jgi:hypothetical protein
VSRDSVWLDRKLVNFFRIVCQIEQLHLIILEQCLERLRRPD